MVPEGVWRQMNWIKFVDPKLDNSLLAYQVVWVVTTIIPTALCPFLTWKPSSNIDLKLVKCKRDDCDPWAVANWGLTPIVMLYGWLLTQLRMRITSKHLTRRTSSHHKWKLTSLLCVDGKPISLGTAWQSAGVFSCTFLRSSYLEERSRAAYLETDQTPHWNGCFSMGYS